jgi:hypothetical protein
LRNRGSQILTAVAGRPGRQGKELALRGLVDVDSRQLAVAIKDEGLKDTLDVILLVYGIAEMQADSLGAAISIAGEGVKSRDCGLGNGVDK